jgi:hypothetical protein
MNANPDAQPLFAGIAEPNASVRLQWTSFNGQPINASSPPPDVSTQADSQGRWAISAPQALGTGQGGVGSASPIWQLANGRYAVSLTSSDALGNASPMATVASFDVAATPSFSVTLSGNTVSFGGTADGPLWVSVNAAGTGSFSRGSLSVPGVVSSSTTVTNLLNSTPKTLLGVSDLSIDLAAGSRTVAVAYTTDAPQLRALTLKGSSGTAADSFTIKIADPVVNVQDLRVLRLDTAGLSANGDSLTFQFPYSAKNLMTPDLWDADVTRLTADSHLSSQFTTINVRNGTIDTSQIDAAAGGFFPPNTPWDIRSGLAVSLDQLRATDRVRSPSASGELIISVRSEELPALEAFLGEPGQLSLEGVRIGLRVDGTMVDLGESGLQAIRDGLDALAAAEAPVLLGSVGAYDPLPLLVGVDVST